MSASVLAHQPDLETDDSPPAADVTTRAFELTYHNGNRAAVEAILQSILSEGATLAEEQELSRTVEVRVSIDSARYSELVTKVLAMSADSGVQFRREIPAA